MKRLGRQAGHTLGEIIHETGRLIMGLFFIAALVAGALAYRLSRGPLDMPWAATRLANIVSGEDVAVHIGKAKLAWAGYKNGSGAPLFLALGDIAARNTGGALLATIPQANLVFSLGALFAGRAPIYVSSQDALIMGSDVPVSLLAAIRLGRGFTLQSADLWVTLGAGALGPPGLDEPVTGGGFLLHVTPRDVALSDGVLDLKPFGRSAPVISIAAAAHRSDSWHGAISLSGNSVEAEDLFHYWPAQLVPMTRAWVTRNITAGTAADARFTLRLSAPLHLASLQRDSATGTFTAKALTLIWLPGVQPLTGLSGKFTLTDANDIDITADTGRLGGITLAAAHMHIAGVSQHNQIASLDIPVAGSVQAAFAVLNGAGLHLLKAVPPPVQKATGDMTGRVTVVLPLKPVLSTTEIRLNVATVLNNVTLPLPVQGLVLRQGRLTVDATLQNLQLKGDGEILGQPANLRSTASFASGTAAAITLDLATTATAAMFQNFGWEPGSFIQGPIPVQAHIETSRVNIGSLTVKADLTPAELQMPVFGWTKPAGQPGWFTLAAGINGNRFSGIEQIDSIQAKAAGLDLEMTMSGNTVELSRVRIGNSEGSGNIVPPGAKNQPWRIRVAGSALDLSAVVSPSQKPASSAKPARLNAAQSGVARPQPPSGFLWDASLHFDRLILAHRSAPAFQDFNFDGNGAGNFIFQENAAALVDASPVTLTITPRPGQDGDAENLRLQTADAGQLLRAIGAFDDMKGGKLDFSGLYGAAAPMTGVTRITNFRLFGAPAFAKILQALTVLGIPEAASGPGLKFDRMVVPFAVENGLITLHGGRAYSASLGFTASGTLDLDAGSYDIQGTVVPAYALNTLPGKIPLIGKLFSPEKGGGLFAMRYSMAGPFADPKVTINPLSALTPGFLREIFGLANKKP